MKWHVLAAVFLCVACGGSDHRAAPPAAVVGATAQLTPEAPPPPPPAPPGTQPYQHPIYRIPPPPRRGEIIREPAVPARILQKVSPKYTSVALKARIQGIVIVEVVVETDGRAGAAEVLKPLPFGLDQSAVDCVRQWRFAPAKDRGRPVRSVYRATIKFELPK